MGKGFWSAGHNWNHVGDVGTVASYEAPRLIDGETLEELEARVDREVAVFDAAEDIRAHLELVPEHLLPQAVAMIRTAQPDIYEKLKSIVRLDMDRYFEEPYDVSPLAPEATTVASVPSLQPVHPSTAVVLTDQEMYEYSETGTIEVAEVHTNVGDVVAEGQILLVVETAQYLLEIPAPKAGRVALHARLGERLKLGATLAQIA